MAAPNSPGRPTAMKSSNSLPLLDDNSSPSSPTRQKRANTLQSQGIKAVPEARHIATSPELAAKKHVTDVFETHEEDEQHQAESSTGTPGPELQLPNTFDELPIEIKSLTERFLESLSAKVHPGPLSADSLADLFQDFYERAASHIATHIASLSSKIGREKSPAPSNSSKGSSIKGRPRAGSGPKRTDSSASLSGGEMLTASEVADRKKARRLLELKRLALEEAVERAVCEKVYARVWKHRSTDDDARDEKLRSKTAALSLVGIGLRELHMESTKEVVRKTTEDKEDEIHHSLAPAREALQHMNDEQYPLGKLQHLTAAHKSIVETLSQLFPAESSADEILPTLIYTLITSPPEGISVVSNLNFIQRFRASSKVDGEAAYCLVNLEAAISFLETVDLSSLRAEELPEGPSKAVDGQPESGNESASSLISRATATEPLKPDVAQVSVTARDTSSSPTEAIKAVPLPRGGNTTDTKPMHQRRVSGIVQAQNRIEAGRQDILSTADKIYESINDGLENSFSFVFGRLKDHMPGSSPLPKTLEDARKLVSSPYTGDEDDSLDHSGRSSPALEDPLTAGSKSDGRALEIFGGRKPLRDRSVDSTRSGESGKRVLFANERAQKEKLRDDPTLPGGNLFATINTINPLNRFNVPGFARFGRAGSVPSTPKPEPSPGHDKIGKLGDIVESPASNRSAEMPALEQMQSRESNGDELNAREVLAELRKLKPPKKRFLDIPSAGELKLAEVEELLLDYRRLAKAIGKAIAT